MTMGGAPPFFELGEYDFQDLCRDLVETQPGIATCDVYGKRGQKQYGIDLIGYCSESPTIEVGQCKCCRDFQPSKFREASDEFFEHLDLWKGRHVKRFILFVACDVSTQQQQDEILRQRQRFAEVDLCYEVWSATKIRNQLAPHQELVIRYIPNPEFWVLQICGQPVTPMAAGQSHGAAGQAVVSAIVEGQLEALTARVSRHTEEKLETVRSAWREGREEDASVLISALRDDEVVWPVLPNALKSRLVCLQASIVLDRTDDIDSAAELANEAEGFASGPHLHRLRAHVQYRRGTALSALDFLDGLTDLDSLNLKAAFLLELGRLEDAFAVLETAIQDAEPNAETHRLFALANLLGGRIERAGLSARKALELAPAWASTSFTSAIVDFMSSLSLSVVRNRSLQWPEPVPWHYVKRDKESQRRIENAAAVFEGLSNLPQVGANKRRDFRVWGLACLGTHEQKVSQAQAKARDLLTEYPTDFRVVFWCISRNYEVDLEPSITALQALTDNASASIPQVVALVLFYLSKGQHDVALPILDSYREFFEEKDNLDTWLIWSAQALAGARRLEEALSQAELVSSPVDRETVIGIVLRIGADDPSGCTILANHLGGLPTGPARDSLLYSACEAFAGNQEWELVWQFADELVERLATADASRLAAHAAFQTGHLERCLETLQVAEQRFPGGRLPSDLRSLRIGCRSDLGLIPQAIQEAETLEREEPSAENSLSAIRLHLRIGDLSGAARATRNAFHLGFLASSNALQLARTLRTEDIRLSQQLWRHARDNAVSDEDRAAAYMLAFELDLENEAGPLIDSFRSVAEGDSGFVQAFTVDDLKAEIANHHQRMAHLDDLYKNGRAPIHLISDAANMPLPVLFHQTPVQNINAPGRETPLFVIFGGREPSPTGIHRPKGSRLILDVTSFFMAAHLEILDLVERVFAPLSISSELVPALVSTAQTLAPHQPSRLRARKAVVNLVDEGRVSTVKIADLENGDSEEPARFSDGQDAALLNAAIDAEGRYLAFSAAPCPQGSEVSSDLSKSPSEVRINCRCVIDALLAQGAITPSEFERARKSLGTEGKEESGGRPDRGAPLFCSDGIAELLSTAGVLEEAADQYQLNLSESSTSRIRAELEAASVAEKTAAWVSSLISNLNTGIVGGTLEVLPEPTAPEYRRPRDERTGDFTACLSSVMAFEPSTNDTFWFDDRNLGGYPSWNGAPIITIRDVLAQLRLAGEIDDSGYFEKTLAIRQSGFHYVPLEAEEILHYLYSASIVGNAVIETKELAVLRRSFASALLHSGNLQRPDPSASSVDLREIQFLTKSFRASDDALIAIWADAAATNNTKAAWADWIQDSLDVGDVDGIPVQSPGPVEFAGLRLASLLTKAVCLETADAEQEAGPQDQFLEWINTRYSRRLETDQQFFLKVASYLKKYLHSTPDLAEEPETQTIAKTLVRRLVARFPRCLREELWSDAEFASRFGIEQLSSVAVGPWHFSFGEFWDAAKQVMDGETQELLDIQSEAAVALRPDSSVPTTPGIAFTSNGSPGYVLHDDLFDLLNDAVSKRERALEQHQEWFDGADDDRESITAGIITTQDAALRIQKAATWRDESLQYQLNRLEERIEKREQISMKDFLPKSKSGLLRFYRLRPDSESSSGFSDALNTAAARLTGDAGVAEAVRRFSGLPVKLPFPVRDALGTLSPSESSSLVSGLAQSASPIVKAHLGLIAHLTRHSDADSSLFDTVSDALDRLLEADGLEGAEALLSVVRWCHHHFLDWAYTSEWPASLHLALSWLYGNTLFTMLREKGAPVDCFAENFVPTPNQEMAHLFQREQAKVNDVSYPHRVRAGVLVAHCASVSLADTEWNLNANQKSAFERLVFAASADGEYLNAGFYCDNTLQPNSLKSFLGCRRERAFSSVLGVDRAEILSSDHLQMEVKMALNEIGHVPSSVEAWLVLVGILNYSPIYRPLADDFVQVLREVDVTGVASMDPGPRTAVLHFLARQASNENDSIARKRVGELLTEIARRLEVLLNGQDDESHGDILALFIDACIEFSAQDESSSDSIEAFSELVQSVLSEAPGLAPKSRPILQTLCEGLSVPDSPPLWKTLLSARSMI
jgi:tetratricopeptide (TPR) repeat protein